MRQFFFALWPAKILAFALDKSWASPHDVRGRVVVGFVLKKEKDYSFFLLPDKQLQETEAGFLSVRGPTIHPKQFPTQTIRDGENADWRACARATAGLEHKERRPSECESEAS